MPETPDPREIAALDAIISFALAGKSPNDFSDEEILAQLDSLQALSEQSRNLLREAGEQPFTCLPVERQDAPAAMSHFAGMFREGSDETLDPEVKAELKKRREQIRARLRAQRKDVRPGD